MSDHMAKEATVVIKDSESNSDSDEDPFDFVAQYRKLEKSRKEAKMNPQPVKDPTVVNHIEMYTGDEFVNNILSKTYTPYTDSTSITAVNSSQNQSQISNLKTNTSINSIASTSQVTNTRKKRGRPCSQNRNKRRNDSYNVLGPVICIGDFYDGYAEPPPKIPVPKVIEEFPVVKPREVDEEDDYCYELLNRVMNVKVYWRKTRTHRFPIRVFQSIESIYEHFAKLEDIHTTHVSLVLRNKLLSPTDSPHSINYKVTDFIDGDMEFYKSPYETSETTNTEEQEEQLTFRIKQKDVKHPVPITIKKTDRMWVLYLKLAEKLGMDVESFTLEFDGDRIKKSDTVERLDLEGDECFDLFQKKK